MSIEKQDSTSLITYEKMFLWKTLEKIIFCHFESYPLNDVSILRLKATFYWINRVLIIELIFTSIIIAIINFFVGVLLDIEIDFSLGIRL
jgi:hypothetical protein